MHFTRTMRSLTAGQSYMALAAPLLAGLLMVAWLAWFFLAPIVVSIQGEIVDTAGDGYVRAVFTDPKATQIQPGQSAFITLQSEAATAVGAIPAVVAEVNQLAAQTEVDLYAQLDSANAALFAEQFQGKVDVAIERISPAMVFLQASGQLIDTPPVSLKR